MRGNGLSFLICFLFGYALDAPVAPGHAAPIRVAAVTPSPMRTHAAWCDESPATAIASGLASAHASTAIGHRVRKPQPLGGLAGLGRSPVSTNRCRPGPGTDENKASV